jgi:hypothetical protein
MATFKDWMANATQEEKELLAEHCNTSLATLYQTAQGYRINPKLHRALDIVEGTAKLARRGLPAVTIQDLDAR